MDELNWDEFVLEKRFSMDRNEEELEMVLVCRGQRVGLCRVQWRGKLDIVALECHGDILGPLELEQIFHEAAIEWSRECGAELPC